MAVFRRRQFSCEKCIWHMHDAIIPQLRDPSGIIQDPLSAVIRAGARKLIEQAIEAELAALLAFFSKDKLADGRSRLLRDGHLPEREVLTGIGPVTLKVPRLRDRGPASAPALFAKRNRLRSYCRGFT